MITGVLAKAAAKKKDTGPTIDDLKAGKPLLVYTYLEVTDMGDECYKFSRKLEVSCFQQKVVDQINANWRATKRTIDIDADRKLEKNQTRLDFYSFTGKLLESVTLKDAGKDLDGPGGFLVKLKQLEKQNRDLCDAEIKRIEAEKAAEKPAKEAAAK